MYYDIAEREFESKNSNLSEIDSLPKEEIKIRLKDKLQKLDRDMAEIRLLLGGFLNRKKLTPLRQAREPGRQNHPLIFCLIKIPK